MSDRWINKSANFQVYAFKDHEHESDDKIQVMFEITMRSQNGGPPLVLEFPLTEQRWRELKSAADRGIYELRGKSKVKQ